MIAALCAILFLAALIFGLAYANRPRRRTFDAQAELVKISQASWDRWLEAKSVRPYARRLCNGLWVCVDGPYKESKFRSAGIGSTLEMAYADWQSMRHRHIKPGWLVT